MLELTGSRCMSGLDAIEFFEAIGDVIDEEVKTDEFCDELTWAINRLRYEVQKSIPVAPKIEKNKYTTYKCGVCSAGVRPDTDSYCRRCGRRVAWK